MLSNSKLVLSKRRKELAGRSSKEGVTRRKDLRGVKSNEEEGATRRKEQQRGGRSNQDSSNKDKEEGKHLKNRIKQGRY